MSFEENVMGLLGQIDDKLNKLLNGGAIPGAQVSTSNSSMAPSGMKPSELVSRQEEAEKAEVRPPVEGRRVCPDCGATQFNTVEDKTQVLHQMGGVKIYAKKYVCRKCGGETT